MSAKAARSASLPDAAQLSLSEAIAPQVFRALRAARTEARVTVYATPREVIVSVVADIDADADEIDGADADGGTSRTAGGVEVTRQREGRSLWIQSSRPVG